MNRLEKLKMFIDANLIQLDCCFVSDEVVCESIAKEAVYAAPIMRKASIHEFIEEQKDNNKFQRLLFEYIDRTDKKDSDIYNKALIDRRLFSKIRSDENYHPSKETIISLGISLELTIEDLEKLLESASYALPKNNVFDLIIRFCIIEEIYDIYEVNTLLEEYKCNLLSL
jgi:hypothetical protein